MRATVDLVAVGERIRRLRVDRGLTQAELGATRFTSAYISLIERGHRKPSEEVLSFLASRLDLTVEELLTGRPPGLQAHLELELHQAKREVDQGRSADAWERVERVLKEARRHALTRVEAKGEETLADLVERSEGPAAALRHYNRADELWRGQPIHLKVNTVTGIAHCTMSLGDPQMAVHLLDSYRRDLITSGQPHPHALMRTYTQMVYAYFAVGLPSKAGEAAREALRLEGQVEHPEDVACMHLTVARSLMSQRQFVDALDSIRRADEIYTAGGWVNKAARARIAEGIVLSKKGDLAAARERLLSALEMLKQSPDRLDEALALNELGRVTRRLDDTEEAMRYLARAAPLLENSDVLERAFNAREAGMCLALRNPSLAEAHLKDAIRLYEASGSIDELVATYSALGDLYVEQGDLDSAVGAFRAGLAHVRHRSS